MPVDYTKPLYQFPRETWDREKCERLAKHVAKDGLGTPYPWPGYIGSYTSPAAYGDIRYNGGCIHDGQWWQGEHRPLPKIHEDFEIIFVTHWGWRIKKKENADAGRTSPSDVPPAPCAVPGDL